MAVVDSRAISSNWYLYAYIDSPLSTSDNKHLLKDSLIFIDADNKISTLGTTPTLIYSGSPNGGNTKTTNISWAENVGILFKVLDPLYNGETYSTSINWILTGTALE